MEQGVRELEAFAAVVYSSNFDMQTPGFEPDITTTPAIGTTTTKVGTAAASSLSPGPSPAEIVTDLNVRSLDEEEAVQGEEDEGTGINLKDEEKENAGAGAPSGDVAEAASADSGFEEVWGKASAGTDASPSPAS